MTSFKTSNICLSYHRVAYHLEIAEAKHYIDEVLEEINNMKNMARTDH